MVGHAFEHLDPAEGSVVFIENVGNLVCPAGFDLGEAHKVVILSVTEGDDKPSEISRYLCRVRPRSHQQDRPSALCRFRHGRPPPPMPVASGRASRVLPVSARTGEGLDNWIAWLMGARAMALAGHVPSVDAAAEAFRFDHETT